MLHNACSIQNKINSYPDIHSLNNTYTLIAFLNAHTCSRQPNLKGISKLKKSKHLLLDILTKCVMIDDVSISAQDL